MQDVPAAACFHCGEALPAGAHWRAPVLGAAREFCCAGCQAVAQTIAAGGFERFYETRASPAGKAPVPASFPAAAYDEPGAQREFVASVPGEEGVLEATLILENVRCAACLWLIEQALRRLPGLVRADVNFATQRAQVAWDSRRARLSTLIETIRALGYDAFPFDPRRQDALHREARRAELWRLFVAGFGAMQVMMYAFPAYFDEGVGTLSRESENLMRWAGLLLTLPVMIFSCGPFFSGAWRELRQLRPGMDTPIALGIATGFAASAWATLAGNGPVYFDSIAMLVFLLLGARFLEGGARRRAARGLDRLSRWSPDFALRLEAGLPVRVPAHALAPGDRVLVAAGERVPADGIVETGRSSVDESLLTGEARPVASGPGDALTGGTVNLEQPLVMRVLRAGAETRAAAIARLVERGAASRPRLVAAADRIASGLTFAVLAVAIAAGLYWHSPWIAAAVLIVACPCALALAAPIAMTAAAGQLSGQGIALMRAGALETLAAATDVVLDKTGTLTEGCFSIGRVQTLGSAGEEECLKLARGLAAASRHPLARAFGEESAAVAVDDLREAAGRGVEGRIADRRVRLGSLEFCLELTRNRAPQDSPEAGTRAYVADEGGFLAAYHLHDHLRAGSLEAVDAMRAAGLNVHLLSGDHPSVVQAVARELGVEASFGGQTPEKKLAYVERLQARGRVVAMVGDGMNDAPVLARADVSFAMASGTDIAQRRADFVVMSGSPAAVAAALRLSRRTMRIVRQNFAWAIAYNAVALPLAAAGWIGPWEAAIGMAASSFIVVLNAIRLQPAGREPSSWKASTSSSLSLSQPYS